MVGKYKKVKVVTNMNHFMARLTPMRIEHALLHPHVNGPTRASTTYNAWKPENTLNWWGTFGAQNMFGTERVNAVRKNHYTRVLPGDLIIGSEIGVHQIVSWCWYKDEIKDNREPKYIYWPVSDNRNMHYNTWR
jgi:hypothetical protein